MNPGKAYYFVDVPGVGYALTISPLTFGFIGREENPELGLFLGDRTKKSELEHIIAQEANKSMFQAILHGIGDNSKFYPPSVAFCIGAASVPFLCPLHIAFITLVGVPFFAVPRYLQKESVGKMKNWLKNAPVYDLNTQPMKDYIAQEGVEQKINAYVTRKKELGFWGQIKSVFKEPAEMQQARLDLAKDFSHLYNISSQALGSLSPQGQYPLLVVRDTYNFVRNAYERKWFKEQKHIVFTTPMSCCATKSR